jgi:hypothetical protein
MITDALNDAKESDIYPMKEHTELVLSAHRTVGTALMDIMLFGWDKQSPELQNSITRLRESAVLLQEAACRIQEDVNNYKPTTVDIHP